jgi:hypothetical protein
MLALPGPGVCEILHMLSSSRICAPAMPGRINQYRRYKVEKTFNEAHHRNRG